MPSGPKLRHAARSSSIVHVDNLQLFFAICASGIAWVRPTIPVAALWFPTTFLGRFVHVAVLTYQLFKCALISVSPFSKAKLPHRSLQQPRTVGYYRSAQWSLSSVKLPAAVTSLSTDNSPGTDSLALQVLSLRFDILSCSVGTKLYIRQNSAGSCKGLPCVARLFYRIWKGYWLLFRELVSRIFSVGIYSGPVVNLFTVSFWSCIVGEWILGEVMNLA
jgi:hypothetical protein